MRKFWLMTIVLVLLPAVGLGQVVAQEVNLTQNYQDDQITFSYPAGWVVGRVTGNDVEIGSSINALGAPSRGLNRGEVYMRILVDVGALASADPVGYLEQLSSQATVNQDYGEIEPLTINDRVAALVTRNEVDRSIERLIGIIDMGNGRLGGLIATVAQDDLDPHYNEVLAILATLSSTEVLKSGYWTFVDEAIRFRYPLNWAIERITPTVVNMGNTDEAFTGEAGQAFVQVVTFDLFAVDVPYEKVVLAIEAEEPNYVMGDLVATTVGEEEGAVVRYTVEGEGIEGLMVLFTLFDGRIGLVNLQTAAGELGNYVDAVTTIAESVEVPATVLLSGAQLNANTFADFSTEDFALKHPPNWLVQTIPTGLLMSNDLDIADRTIQDLRPGSVLLLIYPSVAQLPFQVEVSTPTAITNRFRRAAASIGIEKLSDTIRQIAPNGQVTSTVYGLHPNYDVWVIAVSQLDGRILTTFVYTPKGEMGLHQRQVLAMLGSFDYLTAGNECVLTAINVVNTRAGAGLNFAVRESLQAEQTTIAVAQLTGLDGFVWWQLADGSWIREDGVLESDTCAGLPLPAG